MEKLKYTVVTLMIILGVALIVKSHHKSTNKQVENESILDPKNDTESVLQNQNQVTMEEADSISGVITTAVKAKDIQELNENDLKSSWGQKNYTDSLNTLNSCLKINAESSMNEDLSSNQLVDLLSKSLGNSERRYPEWSQTDLITGDGIKRRLRVEYEYDENNKVFSTIQSYKLNEKGQVEAETLDMDKSVNPSSEYIESLKTEGEILIDEKSERIYFPKGEELMIITRNGKIESISMLKDGKSVSCTGLDKESKVNCQCL